MAFGKSKNKYYAIVAGGGEHIVESWDECKSIRDENPNGAQYKGFKTRRDAAAWLVELEQGSSASAKPGAIEKPAYAVLKGWRPGVYDTWADCKAQIDGLTNICYHKFKNRDMAERWYNACVAAEVAGEGERQEKSAMCYTDGSFNRPTQTWGFGAILFEEDNEENVCIFQGHGTKDAEHWNVTGECNGTVCGVREAIRMGYTTVYVCYDYEGIKKWATYEWEAKTEFTKQYAKKMYALGKQIKIEFQKVKAHTGQKYNEMADELAKEAAGLV